MNALDFFEYLKSMPYDEDSDVYIYYNNSCFKLQNMVTCQKTEDMPEAVQIHGYKEPILVFVKK